MTAAFSYTAQTIPHRPEARKLRRLDSTEPDGEQPQQCRWAEGGITYLIANAVYASVGMFICYELLVMVPSLGFMVALIFAATFIFASRMFRGGPTGAYWGRGSSAS